MNALQILRLSAKLMSANVLGGVLIIFQPIAVLAMTDDATLGVFSLYLSWANLGLLFTSWGFFTLHQRLGARYRSKCSNVLGFATAVMDRQIVFNGIIVASTFTLVAMLTHGFKLPIVAYPAISLTIMGLLYVRWMQVKARHQGIVFLPSMLDQPVREALFLLLVAIFSLWELSGSATIALYVVSLAVSSAALYRLGVSAHFKFTWSHGESLSTINRKRLIRRWRGIAITSFPAELGIYLLKRIDVIIVGLLISTEEAGLYFLLSRIAEAPILVAGALNVIIGPEMAQLQGPAFKTTRRRMYILATTLSVTATALYGFFIAVADRWGVVAWTLGQGPDLFLVYVFLLGYFVYFALGPSNILLTMTGHQRIASGVSLTVLPLHLTLCYTLTLLHGTLGTAVAFSISIILQRLGELALYSWRFGSRN